MKLVIYCLILTFLLASAAIAEEASANLKTVTASGDAAMLHDGDREFTGSK